MPADVLVDTSVWVDATRRPEDFGLKLSQYIQYGASPRATINMTLACKAHAFLDGRGIAAAFEPLPEAA